MKPFLGPPRSEQENWVCGHQAHPGAIHCSRDAAWHGMALDGERIAAGMASCDEHLPHMELSADYVHPHQHPCGVPGSMFRWPENECYLDWDETELLAAETVREAVGCG